jgi:putative transposase
MARRRKFTSEQIVRLLQRIEADVAAGKKLPFACYEVGISEPTYYRWCKEFGSPNFDLLSRLEVLEQEVEKLKRLVA